MDGSGPVGPHIQIVGRTFSRCQMVVSKPDEGKSSIMKGYFPIFAIMLYCGRWWLGWFDPFKTSWNDARMEKTITAFHCILFMLIK